MDLSGLRVIDIHAHFPVQNTMGLPPAPAALQHPRLRNYAQERASRMALEWSTDPVEPLASTPEEFEAYLQRWVKEVDHYGLRRLNFVSAGDNDRLAEVVRRYPNRFTGFAHHRLEPGSHVELKRAVTELGLRGFKQLGPTTDFAFEDPGLWPTWEFLAENELPALIHFGFLGRGGGVVEHPRMSPLSLFQTARDFPEINFIIPHFGAGYFQELLAMCWSLPNIYINTSGSNQWMRWMPYELTLEGLFRKALETIGAGRIVFGSDSSAFPRGFAVRYLQDQVRACYTLGASDQEVAAIFGGNAAKLLKLEDEA